MDEEEGNLITECLNVYSKVAYPYLNEIRPDTISTHETKNQNITESILALLSKKGKLIADKLLPDAIDDNIRDKAKVEDIYSLFKKDKSKRFLLSGKIVLDAVRDGVKNGLFGYATELVEQEDHKYLAEINKREIDINWEGWIIKKDFLHKEIPSQSLSVQSTPMTETTTTMDDSMFKQYHNYRIDFSDPKQMVMVIEKYPILSLGGKIMADCYIELKNESDTISIRSNLKQSLELKSLVQSLLNTNRYTGTGYLTIRPLIGIL